MAIIFDNDEFVLDPPDEERHPAQMFYCVNEACDWDNVPQPGAIQCTKCKERTLAMPKAPIVDPHTNPKNV